MERDAMGRVVTEARIENLKDIWAVGQGLRAPHQARAITVVDALVETGATLRSLPTGLIERLGLSHVASTRVTGNIGRISSSIRAVDLSSAIRRTAANIFMSCTEPRAYSSNHKDQSIFWDFGYFGTNRRRFSLRESSFFTDQSQPRRYDVRVRNRCPLASGTAERSV